MLTLDFSAAGPPFARLLAIGAHSDDIEIGCGGTLLRLVDAFPTLEVYWLVLSAHGVRLEEARASAAAMLQAVSHQVAVHSFTDGFLPYEGAAVKRRFEALKAEFQPDLILTHYGRDAHQDHRLISELTWNTFRDHLILEFEIPKYDGDLGTPNLFVRLDERHARAKVAHLAEHFRSQAGRRWFSPDVFLGLMRLRGMECNAASSYAEAFYCRKAVL
ncbi:MAG: PIG-L family deacetylase [Chloroflexi bacterium]|nr:PIG-L family deacetylase [Chloroflexota bacterium]MBV9599122.1 PIG-L family deacetylase [Chloroflexota bacterium]